MKSHLFLHWFSVVQAKHVSIYLKKKTLKLCQLREKGFLMLAVIKFSPLDSVNPLSFSKQNLTLINKETDKAIPLQAWTGPEGSRSLRLPDFKTIGT
jgi:hypothetical protein